MVGADFLGAAPIIKASPELSSKDRRDRKEITNERKSEQAKKESTYARTESERDTG
ncbi:hypothetical protein KI387_010632, partial [Taxus chinensis]